MRLETFCCCAKASQMAKKFSGSLAIGARHWNSDRGPVTTLQAAQSQTSQGILGSESREFFRFQKITLPLQAGIPNIRCLAEKFLGDPQKNHVVMGTVSKYHIPFTTSKTVLATASKTPGLWHNRCVHLLFDAACVQECIMPFCFFLERWAVRFCPKDKTGVPPPCRIQGRTGGNNHPSKDHPESISSPKVNFFVVVSKFQRSFICFNRSVALPPPHQMTSDTRAGVFVLFKKHKRFLGGERHKKWFFWKWTFARHYRLLASHPTHLHTQKCP